jgi:hypothetical protein
LSGEEQENKLQSQKKTFETTRQDAIPTNIVYPPYSVSGPVTNRYARTDSQGTRTQEMSAIDREDIIGDGDPLDQYGYNANQRRPKSRSGSVASSIISPVTIALLAATIGIAIIAAVRSRQTRKQDEQVVKKHKETQLAIAAEITHQPIPVQQPREGAPVESLPPVYEQVIGGVSYEPAPVQTGPEYTDPLPSTYLAAPLFGDVANGGVGGATLFPTQLEAQSSFSIAAADPLSNLADTSPDQTDFITQARNANSLKFCGSLDWEYIPSARRIVNGESVPVIGTCYKKCDPEKEEMVIWRQLANGDPIYQYMCRRLCPPGTYDLQGFCDRQLYNPEFYTTQRSVSPGAANGIYQQRCGGSVPGINRMMGPYCYLVGQNYQSRGDMRKLPINCPPTYPNEPNGPWQITSSGLMCYKCPLGTKIKGDDTNGYLCAEPCPDGSTDDYTGTTYQCQLNARVAETKFADRLQ